MPTRLVYILSASHSGSTLLAMLLAGHPEICTVGELKATSLGDVSRYLCSCRVEIKRCAFWTAISHLMKLRGFDFDVTDAGTHFSSVPNVYARSLLRPLHRGPFLEWLRDRALSASPAWRSAIRQAQARNAALAQSLCAHTGKPIIVDSSKVGLRLKYLLRNSAFDVRVIRLIRDGRAVALTYTDPATFADAADPRLRGGGTRATHDRRLPIHLAAREWRRSNEEAHMILSRLDPARWTEVRYETLCQDPEATLRNLFAFIGVDASPRRAALDPALHHVIGNGMRLNGSTDIALDDRWTSRLNSSERQVFDSVAGALNVSFGYH